MSARTSRSTTRVADRRPVADQCRKPEAGSRKPDEDEGGAAERCHLPAAAPEPGSYPRWYAYTVVATAHTPGAITSVRRVPVPGS
ncbi:hypothetical protein K376_03559 [Streptomyces sp. PsTaAH-130]|nr:hypothetical protein K376_03559 [Streptomyces sp. PsTaAH-130]